MGTDRVSKDPLEHMLGLDESMDDVDVLRETCEGLINELTKQILQDIREGRKWGLIIGLYSQILTDFPDDIIELATSIYILGVGQDKDARSEMKRRLDLNDQAMRLIRRFTGNPTRSGANMWVKYRTDEGEMSQFMTNTLGPKLLWAFDTEKENRYVREKLYDRLGVNEALDRLADEYPGGIKDEVETRARTMEESDENILDQLVKELIA